MDKGTNERNTLERGCEKKWGRKMWLQVCCLTRWITTLPKNNLTVTIMAADPTKAEQVTLPFGVMSVVDVKRSF